MTSHFHGSGSATPAPLTPREQRVLSAIDEDWLLAVLEELVAIPSVGDHESSAQIAIARRMEEIGLAVDRWDLDLETLSEHPDFAMEIERQRGVGVVGTLGSGNGRSLILNGHIDVVSAGDLGRWSRSPWSATVVGDRVYGRGTVDMKGALCCALAAAKALRDQGCELDGRLAVHSVIGEEDGGVGTLGSLARGHRADAAIVMEPTELAVAPAQAGALSFRLHVAGQAAHGCYRDEGVSAIEKMFPIYRALMELEAERNADVDDPLFADYHLPFALCAGRLSAGEWPSTVAESLTLEGRYGVAPGEDLEAARRDLERCVAGAAATDPWLRENPPRVEWWGAQFAPATTPVDAEIVTAVSGAAHAVTGAAPALRGMTYGADLRHLVKAGIPSVLFGPGDVRVAHRPDEFVPLADLLTAARTLALVSLRWCRAAD